MPARNIILAALCLTLGACANYRPGIADPDGNHGASRTSVAGWRLCYDTGKTKEWDLPPCQNMRPLAPRAVTSEQIVTTTTTTTKKLLPVIHSYTLYFDLNKGVIRSGEQAKIAEISHDIARYRPAQVTVAGHTDTSGKAGYNKALSARRADAVSAALSKAGVVNQVIDKKAYGESDLAVETPDGTKNPENRRVVVDFRK